MDLYFQAEEAFLKRYPIIRDENELETSILGLEFKVKDKHRHCGVRMSLYSEIYTQNSADFHPSERTPTFIGRAILSCVWIHSGFPTELRESFVEGYLCAVYCR